MFINVLSFRNGKNIGFHSETPFSIDKLTTDGDWNVFYDAENKQSGSFRSSELAFFTSAQIPEKEVKTSAKKIRVGGKKK